MKRFLIHVSTYWCGMDDTFRAVAESEMELWDLAEQLAYDNFQSYSCENDIAEEEGYDPDEMEESDWDELWSRVDESTYYSFSIEECEDDGEIVDSKTEIDDYLEVDDISNWEDIVKSNPKSEESLWTSEY